MKCFQKKTTVNPKLKNTYRLWTFQSVSAIEELKTKGIIESPLDSYVERSPIVRSYRWMRKQMDVRGIGCNNNLPIWAWHSCKFYEKAPRLLDARCLLSDQQLIDGIQTIEFECPVSLALLSSYGIWNSMLDEFYTCPDEPLFDEKTKKMLFETSVKKLRRHDAIQVTMPYLKMDWVKDIRELKLKPNNFNYNHEQKV